MKPKTRLIIAIAIVPLYWVASVFVPQIFAYFIATVATLDAAFIYKKYRQDKAYLQKEYAELLYRMRDYIK